MSAALWGLFAFLAGLTLAGFSSSLLELSCGCRASLSPPFIRPDRIGEMMWRTSLAGPFMLANEGLNGWRRGRFGHATLAAATLVAGCWALAQGVIIVSLARQVAALLG